MHFSIEFSLPSRTRKRGGWYVSSCEVLDVHSQGRSRAQAEKNLVDTLSTFIDSCYERGTLREVLRECGFLYPPNLHPLFDHQQKSRAHRQSSP